LKLTHYLKIFNVLFDIPLLFLNHSIEITKNLVIWTK